MFKISFVVHDFVASIYTEEDEMKFQYRVLKAIPNLHVKIVIFILPPSCYPEPPRFLPQNTEIRTTIGKIASFSCKARGEGPLEISWSRRGKRLKSSGR